MSLLTFWVLKVKVAKLSMERCWFSFWRWTKDLQVWNDMRVRS